MTVNVSITAIQSVNVKIGRNTRNNANYCDPNLFHNTFYQNKSPMTMLTNPMHFFLPNKFLNLFRIEPIKTKVLGIIANRDIAAETLILSKTPLLSLVTVPNLDIRSLDMDHLSAQYANPLLQRYTTLTTKQQRILHVNPKQTLSSSSIPF